MNTRTYNPPNVTIRDTPTVIVAGHARCGSSLTLQMLHAAGLRCAGRFPDFEPAELNVSRRSQLTSAFLHRYDAVKILDPFRGPIPLASTVVVWLDRDELQQALSQVKFITETMPGTRLKPGSTLIIANSLLTDRSRSIANLSGVPRIEVSFELAIENPLEFAHRLAEFLSPWYLVDPRVMARCVRPRRSGANCAPGMDIEAELIRGRDTDSPLRALGKRG